MYKYIICPNMEADPPGYKAVGQSFSGMETKMNEVGRTAIRIGVYMLA